MGITAYQPVYWLIALVVFLVIEAATLGLATIWFAGGALGVSSNSEVYRTTGENFIEKIF